MKSNTLKPRLAPIFACLMLGLAAWQFSGVAIIQAKAILAQHLLEDAWADTRNGAQRVKPWPWADTWPVARIHVPRLDEQAIVLSGAQGNSLAFAPGHVQETAQPGMSGVSIVSAHRDTHFAFLRHIAMDDKIQLIRPDGTASQYNVIDIQVVDARSFAYINNPKRRILMLTTCYPFDAIRAGGTLRYVVTAEVDSEAVSI